LRSRFIFSIRAKEEACVADYRDEIAAMLYWLQADIFDRQAANQRLALYAAGDKSWHEKVKIPNSRQPA
jgi:hypothetical protein